MLAALAYRFAKAVSGAPEGFASFAAGSDVRTPHAVVRHINGVLAYACAILRTGDIKSRHQLDALRWDDEVARVHDTLRQIDEQLAIEDRNVDILARLLQGPLADAMTHVGQLAMLRRLAGAPIPAENFFMSDIAAGRLGPDQAGPVSPDD